MKNIKLKYNRLKQKNINEIFYTTFKRLPNYLVSLEKNIKSKFDSNWPEPIPKEIDVSKLLLRNNIIPPKILNHDYINYYLQKFSETHKRDITLSDEICQGNYRILSKKINFKAFSKYKWHSSFENKRDWPLIFYKNINYHDCQSYGDAKYVWEINRHQHFLILGRCYWVTNEEKYASEIVDQIQSWINDNRYLFGINWVEGIEVSLRAISWIWALDLIKKSGGVSPEFLKSFVSYLYYHGEYLNNNLSDKWFVNGNHILAELVGLIHIGHFF